MVGRSAVRKTVEAAAEWVAPEKLKPWVRNPRKNDLAVADVVRSIEQFGFGAPIVARRATGEIIAGHTRLKAALRLKLDRVPVRYLDVSEEDAHRLALADNKLGEIAAWDDLELGELLDELGVVPGFEQSDLDRLLASGDVTEDEAPEPPAEPVTKPGDVWTLGGHRLVCGSCEALAFPLAGRRFDLLVTDPPYGVSYANKNAFLNAVARGNHIQTPIEGDHHAPAEMSVLWREWFSAIREHAASGASYYVTGPQGGDLLLLLLALRDSGWPLRHMLIWRKQQFVLGRCDYHYQHEPILFGWVEGAAHHAVANRGESSVWDIDKPHKSDLHPTMKPVALYARAMDNSSDAGDIVADPFAGSGTALVAAEQIGRICVASEIAPAYCDVIVERWQNLTGGKAIRSGAVRRQRVVFTP